MNWYCLKWQFKKICKRNTIVLCINICSSNRQVYEANKFPAKWITMKNEANKSDIQRYMKTYFLHNNIIIQQSYFSGVFPFFQSFCANIFEVFLLKLKENLLRLFETVSATVLSNLQPFASFYLLFGTFLNIFVHKFSFKLYQKYHFHLRFFIVYF